MRTRVRTGQAWMSEIPCDWRVVPAKALFFERREANTATDVHLTPSQMYGVLPQSEYIAITGSSVVQNIEGQDSMKHVEPDDFIIHLRSFQGGIERSKYEGKVSTAYSVLTPRAAAVPDYFRWVLKSSAYIQELRTTTNQLRDGQSIRFGDFAKVPLPLPPPDEQRAIGHYLDCETARIDALIEEQQRLIELLRERRQTQIDYVVWGGLGDVARVSAPIEPAPAIPEHWQVLRNKNLLSESTALSETGSEELLSVSHLTGITPRSEKNVNMFEAETLEGYRIVEPGDLVINTMWAWMGALGVSRVAGIVSPAYGVYRPRPGAEFYPPYFDYLYRSRPYVAEMTRFSRGIWSSRLRIYPEVFLRLDVVVPTLDEQRFIAAHLDEQTAKIDTLITESERFIGLARERRSALITAAVTGQIDVQEVA
jgi:type I restriction enzyme S subunit